MRGVVYAFIGLGLWGVAQTALACTIAIPPRLPGETPQQQMRRLEALAQRSDWDNSTAVYVARVVSVRLDRLGGREVVLEPVRAVKGG